jgi:hypothetical protein
MLNNKKKTIENSGESQWASHTQHELTWIRLIEQVDEAIDDSIDV